VSTELSEVRAELREIRTLLESIAAGARPVAPESGDDAMVGAEYVARLFKCSLYSVRAGKAGTSGVRWASRHPLRTTRKEAHDALRRYAESKNRPERPRRGLVRRSKQG
jgi:hypothetical protein